MFQLRTEDRLRSWREFRRTIDSMPVEQAITQISEFWAAAPFVPYCLDITKPESWPDPWTLIEDNIYCDIAKCLGIVYTISLSTHRKDLEIEFRSYKDSATGYDYNLAWINQGKYILNMVDRQVVNNTHIDKTFRLVHSYTAVDLRLDYYNN